MSVPYVESPYIDYPNTSTPVDAPHLNPMDKGIANAHRMNYGAIALDSFTGNNDDAKLTSAMAAAFGSTHPPYIVLGNRQHTFNTTRAVANNGFRLRGPGGAATGVAAAEARKSCRVDVTTAGTWLTTAGSGSRFDWSIHGISFTGTTSTVWLISSANVLWTASFRDLSFNGFQSIMGSTTTNCTIDGIVLDGYWSVQDCSSYGFRMGGSDCTLWPDGAFFDSTVNTGQSVGTYHVWLDSLEKSVIGLGLDMTVRGTWGGIRHDGHAYGTAASGTNGGPNVFLGTNIVAPTASSPASGALIRLNGGQAEFRGLNLSFGMLNGSTGHSPVDAGIIMIAANAGLYVNGVTYDRGVGVAETTPLIYNNGGTLRAYSAFTGSKGGTWASVPRIHTVSGSSTFDATFVAI